MSLTSSSIGLVESICIIAVVATCAITDLYKGRIFNVVTYPAALAGLALQIGFHGLVGFEHALWGFVVGFIPALLLFALGGLGGGDVKLLGVLGIFLGAQATAEILVLAALFGTVAGIGKLVWQGQLFRTLWGTLRRAPQPRLELRFGAVIGLAALATLWDLRLGALAIFS